MFQPGEIVGSYRVLHQIGAGGMGVVYAAEHVHLRRPAAVKVLHPWVVASSPEIVERFRNEAIGGAAAEHRNVCRVLDLGQLPSGQWFIALEFLSGESLAAFLASRRGQPVDPLVALQILAEAANGLHFAHERGIVHRDVKPENLFLTQTAEDPYWVRVLDFGIAKLGEMAPGVRTRDHAVMGTLSYMAPEQLLRGAGNVDRRADVYALAVVAHELVTGRSPLGHLTTLQDVIAHHTNAVTPPDPRALRPDLPKALAKAVMRGLESDPRRRWPVMPEFIQALGAATERPGWTHGGMSIVHQYAEELSRAPTDARTAGRQMPSALLAMAAPAGPVTAPARPAAMPMTISDGVPVDPSAWAAPGTASGPPSAVPSRMASTFGHSSGQVFPSGAPARSRRPLVVALVGIGAIVVTAMVMLVMRAGHDEPPAAATPEPALSIAVDASAAMSALAVVTEPAGATVLVDGVARGVAPVNVAVPSGTRAVVRAELPGYARAEQSITIGTEPAALRLTLSSSEPPLAAAAVAPVPAPPTTSDADAPVKRDARHRKRPRQDSDAKRGPEAGTAPAKPPAPADPKSRRGAFSPDDVGGD